ncbi:hypothetical protein M378DRAFT_71243 [Amanita muscaria Koide BX008]|uniref:Uncharacterized protein n=1 Tax=Amanita muscaria (strain Koide BX008) TaxID=946122 RepID=A0A0C2SXZ8_AMAMK|nr:hypothetical protein M378DRAFT_71243 [Amanita muscaria Koide BX008]
METSLPDLPFTHCGQALLSPDFHTSTKTAPRTYPRTDLTALRSWISFPDDVHQVIQSATNRVNLPSTPFTVGVSSKTRFVKTEEKIRAHAMVELHERVEDVVHMFGVVGCFDEPGSGAPIIGDPDFSWVMGRVQPHPKLVVEYTAWWVADLLDLPAAFAGTRCDILSRQSLESLEQIYGYMTLNNNRFGILTNWQRAWFLRRAETDDRKTLDYFVVELDGPNPPISMLKAWVGMILLAEDNWIYASPTPSARDFGDTKMAWRAIRDAEEYKSRPVNGEYRCLPLDFRLCIFDLSSARQGTNGCIVNARFLQSSGLHDHLSVVCKAADMLRYPTTKALLRDEMLAYAALQTLQGQVIPILHGFYEVWGIIHVLALQPVGDAIPEDESIDVVLRKKMKASLRHIHDAGYIHGDIARRNFCTTLYGDVFLVDLERCRPAANQSELDDEMNEVDKL